MLLDGNLEWAPSEDKEEETSSSECHERDPGAASDSDLISSAQLSDARRTTMPRRVCAVCGAEFACTANAFHSHWQEHGACQLRALQSRRQAAHERQRRRDSEDIECGNATASASVTR